jgi:hypothetical protein
MVEGPTEESGCELIELLAATGSGH